MVDWTIADGQLQLHVRGTDRLWALKSSLTIPLAHIASVRTDPPIAHEVWHGLRELGTNLPGVITAGRFLQHGKRIFWDVHHPDHAIGISLHDDRFDELVIEVAEPQAAVATIAQALAVK